MQRRCQEVIDRCWALGAHSPIVSIHDVGAGGLSNALPELVNDSGRGARFELRKIPSDEPGLSPLELWCNEAQERYVLALAPERLEAFAALCARERCPYAVVGVATEGKGLTVVSSHGTGVPPAGSISHPGRVAWNALQEGKPAAMSEPQPLGVDGRKVSADLWTAALPMSRGGRTFGIIQFSRHTGPFDVYEREAATFLAAQVGLLLSMCAPDPV